MNKQEALQKIKELEEFINQSDNLFSITTYKEVCKKLKEKELTLKDYTFLPENRRKKALAQGKIQQLEALFNGTWKAKLDGNQKNWYPYFIVGSGGVLGFDDSYYDYTYCDGFTGFFKDKETSDFIGKTFIDIYREL